MSPEGLAILFVGFFIFGVVIGCLLTNLVGKWVDDMVKDAIDKVDKQE